MLGELTAKQVAVQLQLPLAWIRRNATRLGGRKKGGQWMFNQMDVDRAAVTYAYLVPDTHWYQTVVMRCPDCGSESNRERVKVEGIPPVSNAERNLVVDTPCMFCS